MSARVVTTDAPVDLATRLQFAFHAVKIMQICMCFSNWQQHVLSPCMRAVDSPEMLFSAFGAQ